MTGAPSVAMQLSVIEIAHLSTIVDDFAVLLAEPSPADPALERLTPAAYPDDEDASREFRRLTRDDSLSRRSDDAGAVLRSLRTAGIVDEVTELTEDEAARVVLLALDDDDLGSWMRTLAAVRLVLAERLGIRQDGDDPGEDPRAFVYDWLGYLLESLVHATEPGEARE